MDLPLVNTFMGGDGAKNQDQNWERGAADLAGHRGLRAGPRAEDHLENCPMLFCYDEWPGGHNIATTPRMWRRILEQWGDTIGLNFDPSHLILQMIDIPRFLKEFGPHVLHYQAKDLMIDRDGLYERGVFSMGMGWQIPRLPGLGDVDWSVVHSASCTGPGYEGDCIIEHEDRRFERHRREGQAGLPARPRRPPALLSTEPDWRPLTAIDLATLTERDIAKTIDHCLLRPELDDAFVEDGCRLAAEYDVASVCVPPVRRPSSGGHPRRHGRQGRHGRRLPARLRTTATKVVETRQALADGATELDMVLQIGALKSGRDADVQADIAAVVEVAHAAGAIVKVIFENAYLTDDEKIRACRLTEAAGADFVKTSTGFAPSGATHDDLRLMRANTSPHVQVKAAGGVRTLDALLEVMALGTTRIGATATKTIIDDFRARKAGDAPVVAARAAADGAY